MTRPRPVPSLLALGIVTTALTGLGRSAARFDDELPILGALEGHTEPVYAVAWSPDGRALASGGFDNTLRIWSAQDLTQKKVFEAHDDFVLCVAISPDGRSIATGSLDNRARIWPMPGSGPLREFTNLGGPVRALALAPGGDRLAFAAGSQVQIRAVDGSGDPVRVEAAEAEVEAVAWRADGEQLAIAGQDGRIHLAKPADGALEATLQSPAEAVFGLAYLPENNQLVSADADGAARLWTIPPPAPRSLEVPAGPVAVADDGSRIAALDEETKTVTLWKVEDSSQLGHVAFEEKQPIRLALSNDGGRLAVLFEDKSLQIREVEGDVILDLAEPPSKPVVLAFSTDGNTLAVAGEDHTIRLWTPPNGEEPAALEGHERAIRALAFHPEGQRLLSAAEDGSIRLWNLESSESEAIAIEAEAAPTDLAWSPNGERWAVALEDGSIQTRASSGDTEPMVWDLGDRPISSLAFSSDGERLAAVDDQGAALLFDLNAGAALERFENLGRQLAFSKEGATLVTAGGVETARVVAPAARRVFAGHNGPVLAVAIHPNGNQILTGGSDSQVRFFNRENGELIRAIETPGGAVQALAPTSNQQRLVTASSDGIVRAWAPTDGKPIASYPKLPTEAVSLAVSADNTLAAVGLADGSARVFSLEPANDNQAAEAPVQVIDGHGGAVSSLAILPENAAIMTGSTDGAIKFWSRTPPGPLAELEGHGSQVYGVAWAPDSSQVATAGADKSVRIWNPKDGSQIRSVDEAHANIAYAVAYAPDGELIATGGDDQVIKFWNPEDGTEVRQAEGHAGAVYCLAFHPDGSKLASGSVDKTVRLWDVAEGKELKRFEGHPDDVYAVAFGPDGRRLASIGYGGYLFFWDVESGEAIASRRISSEARTYGLAFSPDGKRLAVAASDRKIHLIDVPGE